MPWRRGIVVFLSASRTEDSGFGPGCKVFGSLYIAVIVILKNKCLKISSTNCQFDRLPFDQLPFDQLSVRPIAARVGREVDRLGVVLIKSRYKEVLLTISALKIIFFLKKLSNAVKQNSDSGFDKSILSKNAAG
jgi:hypothetical protein